MLIIVLLVVAIVAAALIFVFVGKDNVMAALKGLTTSTEDIEKNKQELEQQQTDVLKEHGLNLSPEVLQGIESGEIADEQEIIDKLLGRDEEQPKAEDDNSVDSSSETPNQTDDKPSDEKQPENKDDKADDVQKPAKNETTQDNKKEDKPKDKTDKDNKKDDGKANNPQGDKPAEPQKNEESLEPENNPAQSKPSDTAQTVGKDTQQTQTPADSTQQTDDKQKAVDEQVAGLVAKMYVYKSQYSGSISSLVSSMTGEYYKLPAEQQTYSNKVAIYNRYASQIATMEAQCDAQVNALVSELRALLSKNGRDTSLADSLLSAYAAEKENTKAYYVSRYAD